MTKRIDLKEAEKRLQEKYNGTIEMSGFISIKKYAHFKCINCNTEWDAFAWKIINEQNECKVCFPKKRKERQMLSADKIKSYIESKNCKVNINESVYPSTTLEIKYSCGHTNALSFNTFKKDYGCKKCRIDNFYVNKYPVPELLSILEENELEFIDFPDGYKDGSSKIRYKCKDEHITIRDVKNLVKFPTCKECKIISRTKLQTGSGASSWKGGISKIWVAARRRLDPWHDRSLKASEGICCITGEHCDSLDVHHITSFDIIMKEVLLENGFEEGYYLKTYEECNGEEILQKIVKRNDEYGNGACMKKSIHVLYHKIYGHGQNTPEQFEQFKYDIQSGKIKLS